MVTAMRQIRNDGPKQAEVITVLLKDLFVDIDNYQRPLIASHLANLRRDWDDATAQLLTVNLRNDNVIAVIDGSHRMAIMVELGYDAWQAYAWSGLNIAEEADLFLKLNKNRRHHKAIGTWKAELTRRNPLIMALDRVIIECGYTLGIVSKEKDPFTISCPDRLIAIATSGRQAVPDPERARRVLNLLRDVWAGDPIGARDSILGGIDLFLRKYGGLLNMNAAVQRFSTVPLSSILMEASRIQIASSPKKNISGCVCIALQRAYDRGRRAGRLEPPASDDN